MYTLFKKDSPIKVYVIEFYMYVNNVFLFHYLKKTNKQKLKAVVSLKEQTF